MFLRSYKRKKNGKWHEYFSIVENRRVANGATVQRTVLYLGEITSSQENAWQKTLKVFDADSGKHEQKLFFADQAVVSESEVDSIKVKLSQMQLCRPAPTAAGRQSYAEQFQLSTQQGCIQENASARWHVFVENQSYRDQSKYNLAAIYSAYTD